MCFAPVRVHMQPLISESIVGSTTIFQIVRCHGGYNDVARSPQKKASSRGSQAGRDGRLCKQIEAAADDSAFSRNGINGVCACALCKAITEMVLFLSIVLKMIIRYDSRFPPLSPNPSNTSAILQGFLIWDIVILRAVPRVGISLPVYR